MNDIATQAFHLELQKLAEEELEKQAASYKFKIDKKWTPRLGWGLLGAAAGAQGMDMVTDYRIGNQVRRQTGQ